MKPAFPQRAHVAVFAQAETAAQSSRVMRLGLILLLLLSLSLLWATRPLLAQEDEPAPTEETFSTEEAPSAEEPPANPLVTRLEELEGYPFPLPDFGPGVEIEPPLDPETGEPSEEPLLTCVTLNVPYDHANPDE